MQRQEQATDEWMWMKVGDGEQIKLLYKYRHSALGRVFDLDFEYISMLFCENFSHLSAINSHQYLADRNNENRPPDSHKSHAHTATFHIRWDYADKVDRRTLEHIRIGMRVFDLWIWDSRE